jgi:hypothetical protein
MRRSRWRLAVLLLAVLVRAAPSQQVEVRDAESAFDSNQWNAAPVPRFDLQVSAAVLLPWADSGGRPTARQRALSGLGLVAAGSTFRAGRYRAAVRELILGLRDLDCSGLPRGERILAALALREVATASNYRLLHEAADQQTWTLGQQLATEGPLQLPAMDLLLLHLLVREQSARSGGKDDVEPLQAIARAATCTERLGAHRCADAAWLLVRRLRGEAVPDDLLLAVCWPASLLTDPQHTWIGIVAAGEVTAAARASVLPQLDRLLAARNPEHADHPGSWAPAAGGDRAETTAWHLWTLGRANRLLVQDARMAPAAPTPR